MAQPPALYNLPNDIGETQNLAGAQPADVTALQQLYAQWNTMTVPPLWQWTQFSTLPLVMVGDWNGFDKKNAAPPWVLARTTAPAEIGTPDGFTWFLSTVHVAASGGDTTPGVHRFTVMGDKSYGKQ